jgi:KDO2-lipid IV(A) lauroyltransferase
MEVPVIPAQSYRKKDGTHILEFYPPLEWIDAAKGREQLIQNTQYYNHVLEGMILKHPEQWLWMHKRWKI